MWAVQTLVLTNSINVTSHPSFDETKRHIVSFTGVSNSVRAALAASEKIPENLSAFDAALEFCIWMSENLRDESSKMPGWIYGC